MIIEIDLTPYAFSDEVIAGLRVGMELKSEYSRKPTSAALYKDGEVYRNVHGDTVMYLVLSNRLRAVHVKSSPSGNVMEETFKFAEGFK